MCSIYSLIVIEFLQRSAPGKRCVRVIPFSLFFLSCFSVWESRGARRGGEANFEWLCRVLFKGYGAAVGGFGRPWGTLWKGLARWYGGRRV